MSENVGDFMRGWKPRSIVHVLFGMDRRSNRKNCHCSLCRPDLAYGSNLWERVRIRVADAAIRTMDLTITSIDEDNEKDMKIAHLEDQLAAWRERRNDG